MPKDENKESKYEVYEGTKEGANKELREKLLNAMYAYMQQAMETSKNKYVHYMRDPGEWKAESDGKMVPSSYFKALEQLFNESESMSKKAIILPEIPVNGKEKYLTPEGMKYYLERVDTYLMKKYPEEVTEAESKLLGNLTASVQRSAALLEYTRQFDGPMREISKTLHDTRYTWDERKQFLRYFSNKLYAISGVKLVLPDYQKVNGEKEAEIEKFLFAVGQNIQSELSKVKSDPRRNISRRITYRNVAEQVEKLSKDGVKLVEAAREREELKEKCNNLDAPLPYRHFSDKVEIKFLEVQTLYRNLVDGRYDQNLDNIGLKSDIATKLQETANYLMEGRPSGLYTDKEVELLGLTIETLKVVSPKVADGLEEIYGIQKKGGKYELPEHLQMIKEFDTGLTELVNTVRDADPMLMRSSKEYSDYRKAVETSQKKVREILARCENGGKLRLEDMQTMDALRSSIKATADAYYDYKMGSLKGKQANGIEYRRIQASLSAYNITRGNVSFENSFKTQERKHALAENALLPLEEAEQRYFDKINRGEELSGSEKAELIYLQMLRQSYKDKTFTGSLEEACQPREIIAEAAKNVSVTKAGQAVLQTVDFSGLDGEDAAMFLYSKFQAYKIQEEYQAESGAQPGAQAEAKPEKNAPQVDGKKIDSNSEGALSPEQRKMLEEAKSAPDLNRTPLKPVDEAEQRIFDSRKPGRDFSIPEKAALIYLQSLREDYLNGTFKGDMADLENACVGSKLTLNAFRNVTLTQAGGIVANRVDTTNMSGIEAQKVLYRMYQSLKNPEKTAEEKVEQKKEENAPQVEEKVEQKDDKKIEKPDEKGLKALEAAEKAIYENKKDGTDWGPSEKVAMICLQSMRVAAQKNQLKVPLEQACTKENLDVEVRTVMTEPKVAEMVGGIDTGKCSGKDAQKLLYNSYMQLKLEKTKGSNNSKTNDPERTNDLKRTNDPKVLETQNQQKLPVNGI